MSKSKMIIYLLLLNFFALSYFAQDKSVGDSCPVFEMTEPSGTTPPGDMMIFTVQVKGAKPSEKMTFNWSVDRGQIVSGQGTPSIKVNTAGLNGESINARAEVSGSFLNTCESRISGNGNVESQPEASLIETLKNPNCEYHMMIMDSFFNLLQNEPSAVGYIITYGSPRTVAVKERQTRNYIKVRGVDQSRFVFVNGGGRSRKATIEFWLVPAGAKPPTPTELPEDEEAESEGEIKEESVDKTKPYIFSSEYYDGVQCYGESSEIDLEGYAQILKENPKARGNIVIMLTSKAEFRKKEKEIVSFLTKKGIARKRLRTFHKNSFGGVEIWVLP